MKRNWPVVRRVGALMRHPWLVVATVTALAGTAGADSLGRDDIKTGVAGVRPAIDACARHAAADDIVKTAVRVAPGGRVTSVVIKQTPSAELGSCVAAALQSATFRATTGGGTFSYPFIFRHPAARR